MPQKPTMPSPYMETVDATEPITLSCTIDNRDTIVDYEFNIEEIGSIKDATASENEEFVLPPIFVGSETLKSGYSSDYVEIYKDSIDSTEYTMVVKETYYDIDAPDTRVYRINGTKTSFSLNGVEISTDNIIRIIQSADDKTVRQYKFSNYPNLREIIFLGDVTRISSYILSGSNSIKEFTFPTSLGNKSVLSSVFAGNQSIEKITISNMHMFYYVSGSTLNVEDKIPNVKEVIVNNSTDTLDGVFTNNTRLEKITFLNPITNIKDKTFDGCTNLKSVVGLENVETIGRYAFRNCKSLSNFFNEFMSVKLIKFYAFKDSGLTQLVVSKNLEEIDSCAFDGCTSLTNVIAITSPTNATIIDSAFYNCKDCKITLYGRYDVLSTTLYATLCNSFSSVNFENTYSLDGYSPVPLHGGTTLQRTIDANYLENDKEYCWNVVLKDNYGKTLTTPNYYFRTRSAPTVSISKISTEVTEMIDNFEYDGDGIITALITNNNILSEKSYYIDYTPEISFLSELSTSNNCYVEENKIKNYISGSAIFTGATTEVGIQPAMIISGTIGLYHLPSVNSSGEYYNIQINLPVTETVTVDDTTETLTYNKWFTLALERSANEDVHILAPGIESETAEEFTIVAITNPNADEKINGVISIESGAEYEISYNGTFGDGTYTVTYSYELGVNYYTHTFTAEYDRNDEFSDLVPLKSSRWTLYEVDVDKQYLVDDTGIIYGSYLSYTYSRFLPNCTYRLYLEVENDEGVIATTMKEFSTTDYSTDIIHTPKVRVDRKQNAVEIALFDASTFYSIIRTDIARKENKLIAEEISGEQRVYDFTAASNTQYRYTVYAIYADGNVSVWESSIVCPDWCKVSVIGFVGSFVDNNPIEINAEDIWCFGLNMGNIEYQQNISKTLSVGTGSRYPHITSGNTNYGKFNISALVGEVDNGSSEYVDDTVIRIEKWEEFVASAMAKLVVDTKGRVCVCDTTSNTDSSEIGYMKQPTTINAALTEIASSNKVSLIMIKAGV